MQLDKDSLPIFRVIVKFNLLIGFYNLYLWNQSDWWFNFVIGSLNIGAWVFNRKV